MTTILDHPPARGPAGEEPGPKRVLILERDASAFARLAAPIEADPSLELVTVSSETSSLLDLVAIVRPHVALVDTRIDDNGSAELIQQLHDAASGIRCIGLSDGDDDPELNDMFAAGLAGWMDKGAPAATIIDAVRSAVGQKRGQPDGFYVAPRRGGDAGQRLAEVREVIRQRRFRTIFQPIADLATGHVIGMEALARFIAGPCLPPDAWLKHAESVGLRNELEVVLLDEALKHARALPPQAFLTVNLSPDAAMLASMSHAFPAELLGRLVVEITDHRQVEDYGPLAEALAGVRAKGLRIAVDDSGHGLASLHRVTELHPDFIKLNRTLTRDIDRDATRRILGGALMSVAGEIGAAVIAEGIETSAELETLRSLGIAFGQGYLIARPEPLPAFGKHSIRLPAVQPTAHAMELSLLEIDGGGFRESARAAFELLERELRAGHAYVSHLDYQQRRFRVISCSDALGASCEAGFASRLEESLCFYMTSGKGSRLCGNAAKDPVYGGLPLRRAFDIVSYAAVPLELPSGPHIGTLAVVSDTADRYDEGALRVLYEIARTLGRALEADVADSGGGSPGHHLRTLAATDPETGVLNRVSFLERLSAETATPGRRRPSTYLLHIAVDDHREGEMSRVIVAKAVSTLGRETDVVGRLDERSFAALLRGPLPGGARDYPMQVASRLADLLAECGIDGSVHVGMAPVTADSPAAALQDARDATKRAG